eukprot:jgi/Galph1/1224/GphlegSOOS_G6090.1
MVFEGTIASLLTSLISKYACAKGSDVGLGIRGGYLSLENVELKVDVLNSDALPFRISSGKLGKLKAQIPWYAMGSKPVELYGENLYLLAEPKRSEDSQKNCNSREKSSNEASVSNLMKETEDHEAEVDDESTKWYTTKLGRLGLNVSVELYNVCFEYKDEDCEVSIRLASFVSFSTDSQWRMSKSAIIDVPFGTPFLFRKLFGFSGLLIYSRRREKSNARIERTPLIDGLNFEVRLTLSTTSTVNSPSVMDIEVELDEPYVSFSNQQLAFLERLYSKDSGKLESAQSIVDAVANSALIYGEVKPTNVLNTDENMGKCGGLGWFSSVWHAIVGESLGEDDTADVLGVNSWNVNIQKDLDKAKNAIDRAADSGGRIYSIRIRTEDRRAREENEKLLIELNRAKETIQQLMPYKEQLESYEQQLTASEEHIQYLRDKNGMLLKDIEELEALFSESSRNKDAVIRELEAALSKAERNLVETQKNSSGEEWQVTRDIRKRDSGKGLKLL